MLKKYNGEDVIEFQSKCPVEGCSNPKDINWRHRGCSKIEYLNSKAEIICTDCGHKNGFFCWKFNCGYHDNYKPPLNDPQRLIAAFSIVGRLTDPVGKEFLTELMVNLIAQA